MPLITLHLRCLIIITSYIFEGLLIAQVSPCAFDEQPNKTYIIMKVQRDILAYFHSGGKLTVQTAFHQFHTTELRKVVSRLRRSGYDIRSNRKSDTTEDGRHVTFNEYYLYNEQSIQTA